MEPPLWVRDIRSNGRVAIGGVGYEVGSAELIDLGAVGAGEPWENNRELPAAVTDD